MPEDVDVLKKLPGIGAKTAGRMLVELNNLNKYLTSDIKTLVSNDASNNINLNNQAITDAISGLVALGYNLKNAKDIINTIITKEDYQKDISEAITSSDLIKLALKKV